MSGVTIRGMFCLDHVVTDRNNCWITVKTHKGQCDLSCCADVSEDRTCGLVRVCCHKRNDRVS